MGYGEKMNDFTRIEQRFKSFAVGQVVYVGNKRGVVTALDWKAQKVVVLLDDKRLFQTSDACHPDEVSTSPNEPAPMPTDAKLAELERRLVKLELELYPLLNKVK